MDPPLTIRRSSAEPWSEHSNARSHTGSRAPTTATTRSPSGPCSTASSDACSASRSLSTSRTRSSNLSVSTCPTASPRSGPTTSSRSSHRARSPSNSPVPVRGHPESSTPRGSACSTIRRSSTRRRSARRRSRRSVLSPGPETGPAPRCNLRRPGRRPASRQRHPRSDAHHPVGRAGTGSAARSATSAPGWRCPRPATLPRPRLLWPRRPRRIPRRRRPQLRDHLRVQYRHRATDRRGQRRRHHADRHAASMP